MFTIDYNTYRTLKPYGKRVRFLVLHYTALDFCRRKTWLVILIFRSVANQTRAPSFPGKTLRRQVSAPGAMIQSKTNTSSNSVTKCLSVTKWFRRLPAMAMALKRPLLMAFSVRWYGLFNCTFGLKTMMACWIAKPARSCMH